MDQVNEDYWYNQWHLDSALHESMCINEIKRIVSPTVVSVYADTDSLFVSFDPAISHCNWKNIFLNNNYLSQIKEKFAVVDFRQKTTTDNPNCVGIVRSISDLKSLISKENLSFVIVDGFFVKDRMMPEIPKSLKIKWNWATELDFIHGIDYFRYGQYFKDCLDQYATKFGVRNREDFELERVSESIVSIAKKKYIQNIVYEDGIPHDSLSYIFPKGVELVRSSTPTFAREKIVAIVKYLFANPSDYNIRDLLKLVKQLRKEFELADIDEIAMQSSVSNYEVKVLEDKDKLEFVSGTHFAVKAAAYYNYLLHRNKSAQQKYEFIKSGTKIKYYYCKNNKINDIFAYIRGAYPIEFSPEIDYDTQFEKCILSPINSIIEPLGMPEITRRLSVVVDIFGKGF